MNKLSFYWLWPCSQLVTEPVAKSVWTARGQHGHIEERNPSCSSCRHARRHRSGKADLESSANICGLICNRLNRLQTFNFDQLINIFVGQFGLLRGRHSPVQCPWSTRWRSRKLLRMNCSHCTAGWLVPWETCGSWISWIMDIKNHEYHDQSWIFMNVLKTCSIQDPKHVSY